MTETAAPQIASVNIIPAPRTPHASESLAPAVEPVVEAHHHILDVDLQVFSSPAVAAEHVLRRARGRERGLSVFTCNVDHLMMIGKNDKFHRAYRAADVVTIDGAPLAALSRFTGTGNASRVTGVDLTAELIKRAAQDGLKVALVGGAVGRGDAAAARLLEQFPGLLPMYVDSPEMGFEIGDQEDDRLVRSLQAYRPDVVVVCLGAPKQELWIDRHRHELPGAAMVGAGATIDFLSGFPSRAPKVFQKTGTEAFFRLATDFRRLWRRYLLNDSRFLLFFAFALTCVAFTRVGLSLPSRSHAVPLTADRSMSDSHRSCELCRSTTDRGSPRPVS